MSYYAYDDTPPPITALPLLPLRHYAHDGFSFSPLRAAAIYFRRLLMRRHTVGTTAHRGCHIEMFRADYPQ